MGVDDEATVVEPTELGGAEVLGLATEEPEPLAVDVTLAVVEMVLATLTLVGPEVVYWLMRVLVKVKGQTVVETAVTAVTIETDCERAGQLVTVAAHMRTVTSSVS